MIKYLTLLRPPTPKFIDKLIYLSAIIVIPFSVVKRKKLKESLFIIFPKLMPKDLLINFHGVKFIVRKGKTDILLLNKVSEPWKERYFKLSRGEVFVDVGTHVGKYSLPAAKMVGQEGKVIAIEAHPENFEALRKNIVLNGFRNVIVLNVAAYNKDDEELILSGSRDDGYSLKSKLGENSFKVKTRTIDSILRQLGISTVDWVKIDVEGAEVEVIEGMKDTIANSPKLRIFIEIHGEENRRKMESFLKNFKKKNLGGDDPNIPIIFYWKD